MLQMCEAHGLLACSMGVRHSHYHDGHVWSAALRQRGGRAVQRLPHGGTVQQGMLRGQGGAGLVLVLAGT